MVDYAEWEGEEREVELRGVVRDIGLSMLTYDGPPVIRNIMVEGPRGTGKSRGALQVLYALCHKFPGSRGLLARNKRRSMSGTTLPEWEKCMDPGDPAKDGPKPEGRSVYRFENGTEVYAAGLDESDRLRSFTLDWIYYEEGTESESSDAWESLTGALRSWKMPFQFIMTTVNPKQPGHWLNVRANKGLIERHRSRFEDNPTLYDTETQDWTPTGRAFIENLKGLTGHRRLRDYEGIWSAASGMVFPEFSNDTHVINARRVRSFDGDVLHVDGWSRPVEMDDYFFSMDFGYRAPGVLQIWGVNRRSRNLFLCAEVYQPGRQLDWWADVLVAMSAEFPFRAGVGDCAEPRTLDFLNDRLGFLRDRPLARVVHKADKSAGKLHGLDQLRYGFKPLDSKVPRTYVLKDCLRYGAASDLVEASKPTCLAEEIERYVWDEADPNRPQMEKIEEPSDKCADHSIDAAVYAHVFAWKRFFERKRVESRFRPGSLGATLTLGGKALQWPK